jgi:hypothetical protein
MSYNHYTISTLVLVSSITYILLTRNDKFNYFIYYILYFYFYIKILYIFSHLYLKSFKINILLYPHPQRCPCNENDKGNLNPSIRSLPCLCNEASDKKNPAHLETVCHTELQKFFHPRRSEEIQAPSILSSLSLDV